VSRIGPIVGLSLFFALPGALSADPVEPPAEPAAVQPLDDAGPPRLAVHGFSNVDFAMNEEGAPLTFALGELDLFLTSQMASDVSFLAEIVVEFENGAQEVDTERLQFKWAPSALFSVLAGRMHTPFGYWNQTFHHGTWFQTTETRPLIYAFEHDYGILPVHGVGVAIAGTRHSSVVDLKYSVTVGNGRGTNVDEVLHAQDVSDAKAFSVWIGAAPIAVEGLELGGSGYFDKAPPDGERRTETMREQIFTGYLAYRRRGVELLAEATRVLHRLEGETFRTWGGYVQASVKRGRWTPYYRFDTQDVAENDPFFRPAEETLHTVGLRVDPRPWVALKGEYRHRRFVEKGVYYFAPVEDSGDSARLQLAFAF
jgi:hypothetical protein